MTVSRLRHVPGIGVDRMGNAADRAADPDLLRLENLDTDIPPPQSAIEATRAAVGRDDCNSYLPFFGQEALRKAAAAHVGRLSGIEYDWSSQCIVCAGGLSGILTALLALLEPGDEVLMTDPIYAGLVNRVRIAGGVPRLVPLVPGPSGWRLDLDALKQAVSPRLRVVLMMSPSMPTGAALNREEWQAVADVCRRSGAWLLYDAAMERILFGGHAHIHPASLPAMAERTITVGSVSKEHRMIGWRVGWIVGPRSIMPDIGLASLSNVVCQVGIGMPGATAALTGPDDGVAAAVAQWQQRHDTVLDQLKGLPVVPASGGWSVLLDAGRHGLTGADASQRLFEVGRVAATPMVGWGSERAASYVRFVYANEPVSRLLTLGDRVRRALKV